MLPYLAVVRFPDCILVGYRPGICGLVAERSASEHQSARGSQPGDPPDDFAGGSGHADPVLFQASGKKFGSLVNSVGGFKNWGVSVLKHAHTPKSCVTTQENLLS